MDIVTISGYNGTAQGTSFLLFPFREDMHHMRRMFTAAAAIAAFGVAGVASAQSNAPDLTPTAVTFRAGVSLPLDDKLTDVGNSLINLGLEYIPSKSLIKGGETFYSLDYFAASFQGDRGTVMPLMINQRWYNGGPDVFRRSYLFLGVGVAFIDVTNSGTAVAVRGGYGQELSDHIIAEIAGYISDKAGGARANAVTVCLGYRF